MLIRGLYTFAPYGYGSSSSPGIYAFASSNFQRGGSLLVSASLWPSADHGQEQQCGQRTQARARHECGARPAPVPERAHQEGCRKYCDAEGQIIQPVSRAALLRAHEVCDQRLLRAFGQTEVNAADEKDPQAQPDRVEKGKAR